MTVFTLLMALVLGGMEPQGPPTLQTPNPNRIEDVLVTGNRRIRSDAVRFNLQSKRGDIFDPLTIQRDMKALYGMQVFDDVRVEEEEGKTGKIVTFVVKEKPLIRGIEYEGIKSITRAEILEKFRERKVGLSIESPYDPSRIRRAETVIKSMLAEKGRQNAKIEVMAEDIPPNAVIVTFNVDEGDKIKIAEIEIEGNQVFDDGKIKKAMKLVKEAGPLTAFNGKDTYYDLKLADDLTRIRILYAENGYVRVNIVDPVVETKGTSVFRTLPFIKPPFPWGIPIPFWKKNVDRFFITIKVEENEQYKVGDVKITGSKAFTEDQVKFVLGLIPGQIYNETQLRTGFDNLKKLYGARGYINFTPLPIHDFDEQKKLVNLTINVDEDRQFLVNRIAFSGNTTTRDKVIRREIMVDEGNIFSSTLWDISRARLNQLGYFDEIKEEDAEVKPHPIDPSVDVTLKVKEKGRNSIGFNGGVSGIGGSFLGIDYQTNNFLGFGETLAVSLQGGTRQSNYQFSFTEPYFLDRPLSLGLSVFASNYRFDQAREFYGLDPENLPSGLGFENRLNYEQQRVGFNVYGSYPFKIWSRLGLTYQWTNSETGAVNEATRDYFTNVRTQEAESFITETGSSFGRYKQRKVTPTYTYNTIQNPFNPTGGQNVTTSFEFTGGPLGGNVNFYRPTFEYRFFKPLGFRNRPIFAMRAMASHVRGFSNTSVPFYERFYLGGDFDIRGFDFRAISPISFITRSLDTIDPETGNTVKRPFDDIVYVGGDTQAVANFEYRIPVVGQTITLAPFLDIGNTWAIQKQQLQRDVIGPDGEVRIEGPRFLGGTNSGFRASTGLELQVLMPVINQPFRLIFAFNPQRVERTYFGTATGLPFFIREPGRDIKFTVGKTF